MQDERGTGGKSKFPPHRNEENLKPHLGGRKISPGRRNEEGPQDVGAKKMSIRLPRQFSPDC